MTTITKLSLLVLLSLLFSCSKKSDKITAKYHYFCNNNNAFIVYVAGHNMAETITINKSSFDIEVELQETDLQFKNTIMSLDEQPTDSLYCSATITKNGKVLFVEDWTNKRPGNKYPGFYLYEAR